MTGLVATKCLPRTGGSIPLSNAVRLSQELCSIGCFAVVDEALPASRHLWRLIAIRQIARWARCPRSAAIAFIPPCSVRVIFAHPTRIAAGRTACCEGIVHEGGHYIFCLRVRASRNTARILRSNAVFLPKLSFLISRPARISTPRNSALDRSSARSRSASVIRSSAWLPLFSLLIPPRSQPILSNKPRLIIGSNCNHSAGIEPPKPCPSGNALLGRVVYAGCLNRQVVDSAVSSADLHQAATHRGDCISFASYSPLAIPPCRSFRERRWLVQLKGWFESVTSTHPRNARLDLAFPVNLAARGSRVGGDSSVRIHRHLSRGGTTR